MKVFTPPRAVFGEFAFPTHPLPRPTMKKLNIVAIVLFCLLGAGYLASKWAAAHFEQQNVYSVSELKYDDTTYNYVKGKCDSGEFAHDSQTCANLRQAR